MVDLAAGHRAQEHEVALGERQLGRDLPRAVAGVGEGHLGGEVLADEGLAGHGHGELQTVGVVAGGEPAHVDGRGRPADRLP